MDFSSQNIYLHTPVSHFSQNLSQLTFTKPTPWKGPSTRIRGGKTGTNPWNGTPARIRDWKTRTNPWNSTSTRIRGRKMEASPWNGPYTRIRGGNTGTNPWNSTSVRIRGGKTGTNPWNGTCARISGRKTESSPWNGTSTRISGRKMGDDRPLSCRATSGSQDISLEIFPFASLRRYDNWVRTQSIWQPGASPVDMITKCKDIYAPVFLAKIPIAVSLFAVYLLQLKGFQLPKHLFAYTCVTL